MKHDLAMILARVTERAALAGYDWLGRGDKNQADGAAVEAMRNQLNQSHISGTIVIGEGEIDEAPMLYIGETLGLGGEKIDIAVDPIEGTRMTAMGQNNAIAVLAAAEAGTLLKAPDMYMEKITVNQQAKGTVDLNRPLFDNITAVAKALNKPLTEVTVAILAKPRHDEIIKQMHQWGVRVYAVPDGDVAASILACMPESDVDMMYGIGGAPEGVISAAAMRALGGDMQARLLPRHEVKGDTPENRKLGEEELRRCDEMGIEANQVLTLDRLASSDNVIFVGTGLTKGDLVEGVIRTAYGIQTETLIVNGYDGSVSQLKTQHRNA